MLSPSSPSLSYGTVKRRAKEQQQRGREPFSGISYKTNLFNQPFSLSPPVALRLRLGLEQKSGSHAVGFLCILLYLPVSFLPLHASQANTTHTRVERTMTFALVLLIFPPSLLEDNYLERKKERKKKRSGC